MLFVLIQAFLLGSIPFGILIARLLGGPDIRSTGSGNIGATNVSRVLGFWPAGFFTFLFDTLKGTLAVQLAQPVAAGIYEGWTEFSEGAGALGSPLLQWMTALLVVLGHCYTPWLRFRGGKGVATAFGALVLLTPWAALAGVLAFVVTFLSTRVGSRASLTGLLVLVVAHLSLPGFSAGSHLWAGAALVFLVLARHEGNLDALLESRERQF